MKNRSTLTVLMIAGAFVALAGCAGKKTNGDKPTTDPNVVTNDGDFKPQEPRANPGNDGGIDEGPVTDAGKRLQARLRPAFFGFDRFDLSPEARETLTEDARAMREGDFKHLYIVVEGHCDERGTNEYNLALGERRSKAARDFLLQQGVDSGRLGVISYGEEKPFETGHDEFAWAQNRRAHMRVNDR